MCHHTLEYWYELFTGKSLLFTIYQNLIYGNRIDPDKYVSDAMMYQKLAGRTKSGRIPVYGKVSY